jgi:hypothetical protein
VLARLEGRNLLENLDVDERKIIFKRIGYGDVDCMNLSQDNVGGKGL